MICCRIEDGPVAPLDYHFMATSQPPEVIVLGRVGPDSVWIRLSGSVVSDPDFSPQTYRLNDATPVAMDEDGEPVYSYRHTGGAEVRR
jgi:hypothetical protein